MEFIESVARRNSVVGIIVITAVIAVVINLVIYGIGTLAGGTFDFLRDGEAYHVDAFTLSMFTAGPILIGLAITALAARLGDWVFPAALIIGPVAAIGSTFIMTFPEDDFDTISTSVLVASHIVLGIVIAAGVLALRTRMAGRTVRYA